MWKISISRYRLLYVFGLMLLLNSFAVSQTQGSTYQQNNIPYKSVDYTFKDINLLSKDMILRGVNPSYDFYIPAYRNLRDVKVVLKIYLPEYLRKDSSVTILVDDVPKYTIGVESSERTIELQLTPQKNREFIKLSIRGYLRVSNNICEDVFSDKPYLVIKADSSVSFTFGPAEDIQTFLMDYQRQFCIQDMRLLPLVYYLSKVRAIPPVFHWGVREGCEKIIVPSTAETKLEGNTLYISEKTIQALQENYRAFIFGKSLIVQTVESRKGIEENFLTLKDLAIRTSTIRGMANLSFYIPFNIAYFGGMPKDLYFTLHFAHTPPHQKDKMELRIYLNDALIESIPLEGGGRKSINVSIPTKELFYGYNALTINLVNFTSSDNCFGAVTQSAFTVFDDSHFRWNHASKNVSTIADFLSVVHGSVGLIVEDKTMLPFVVKFLNLLAYINKNIDRIEIITKAQENKGYDFLFVFDKNISQKGLFEIYDPSTRKVIFSASYHVPFLFVFTNTNSEGIPVLTFRNYGEPNFELLSELYSIEDYSNLFGNVAVIGENYFASFDTLYKLRMRYEGYKGISYYWSKYKLFFIILLALPVLYLLIYTYRKLTRRVAE